MITLTDMIILAGTYLFVLFVVLFSIRTSKASSNNIPKRTVAEISWRLAFVLGAAYLVLCYVGEFNIPWIVALSLFVLSVSIVLSFVPVEQGLYFPFLGLIPQPLELAIGIAVVLPVYAIKWFVLGIPGRNELVSGPPKGLLSKRSAKRAIAHELQGQSATVIATLRPIGKIECDGTRFEAISFDGSLIEVGQLVQIGELQNRLYVVHPVSMDA